MIVALLDDPVQVHAEGVAAAQVEDLLDVEDGHTRIEIILVAGRETATEVAHELLAVLFAELLDEAQAQPVLPRQRRLHDLLFYLVHIHLEGF